MNINLTQNPQDALSAYLRTSAAAAYLGIGKSTLERKRVEGSGPLYRVLGPRIVVYARHDLDAWASVQVFSSTSQKAN